MLASAADWIDHPEFDARDLAVEEMADAAVVAAGVHVGGRSGAKTVVSDPAYTLAAFEDVWLRVGVEAVCRIEAVGSTVVNDAVQRACHELPDNYA